MDPTPDADAEQATQQPQQADKLEPESPKDSPADSNPTDTQRSPFPNGDAVAPAPAPAPAEPDADAAGAIELVRRDVAGSSVEQRGALVFRGLGYEVTEKKAVARDGDVESGRKQARHILKEVSGVARYGQILAILGPSGSGKSTLLDILAGRVKRGRAKGAVTLDGRPRGAAFKRTSAYVAQADALLPTLTVQETLQYAAEFRLPTCLPSSEKAALVGGALDELGLRSAADTKIGNAFIRGVSGGQKRRVSIGIELIARPSILFLDVPTSGLDSTAALSLARTLRQLADRGNMVVASINQPSAKMFSLFDSVLLLSEGRLVFFGPAGEASTFFREQGLECPLKMNPADFFLDKINTDFPGHADVDRLIEGYQQGAFGKALAASLADDAARSSADSLPGAAASADGLLPGPAAPRDDAGVSRYASSFAHQLATLLRRYALDSVRNPTIYWLRIVMYSLLSLMVGSLFWDVGVDGSDLLNRTSVLFFVAAFLTFMSVSAVPAFIDERAVFVRERASGSYSVSAYVIANSINSIPWMLLIAIISSAIVYPMVRLRSGAGPFFFFVLTLFLALYCAESLMVTVSAVVPFALVGIAIGAALFGLFMLTCGFFLAPDDIPGYWKWVYYVSFQHYVFEAFLYNDFAGLTVYVPMTPLSSDLVPVPGTVYIRDVYGIDSDTRGLNVGILVVMIIFYRLCFAALLKRFQRGKRG